MSLFQKLTENKTLRILGINSGTSADGLDLALIEFSYDAKSPPPQIKILSGDVVPYPNQIRREIERLIVAPVVDKEQLCRFDLSYGQFIGRTAAQFVHSRKAKVDLIGSHGQTIGHFSKKEKSPTGKYSATMQIGAGSGIAIESGLPVVTNFRSTDVALSGEGAPLTPFVNSLLFGDKLKSRIILNIGGIANFSYLPVGHHPQKVLGGDCGPGNIISDKICQLLFHKPFDQNGSLAQQGTARRELVQLIKKSVPSGKNQRSLGREQFGIDLIARLIHLSRNKRYEPKDILTSALEASAQLVVRSIKKHLDEKKLEALYLTGGGRRNITLVKMLSEQVKRVKIWPVEKLGADGDLLEAASFAVLAGCFVSGIGSTISQVTGAETGGIAGQLSLPPTRKRV